VSTSDVETLVIGAGVAGLAAASELESAGRSVLVVEAADAPGGVMRSDRVRGFVVERGPNTFQIKPEMAAFLERHDLASHPLPAAPEGRRRCLWREGRLVEVPLGPLALARSPLMSTRGKLRLLAEPFVRRGDGADESVAEFVARRLGPELVGALVAPFLTGVYAGDEQQLGADAVFPALVELERERGSIALGALWRALTRRAGAPRGRAGTWSLPDGLGSLAGALAERLHTPVRLAGRVREIEREAGGWRVGLSGSNGDETLVSRSIVLATPAPEAAEILAGALPAAAEILRSVHYAPIVALTFDVDPKRVREPIEGFGFLVPREEKLGLLGCLFMSRIFPGRAPAGRELLHCMLGGERWPEVVELTDELIVKRALGDLDRCLGLRAEPGVLALRRWPRAVPQPGRGHAARVRALRRCTAESGGLALAGAYLQGVAVADALASGVAAAHSLG